MRALRRAADAPLVPIALGAVLLLAPAAVYGRPFVYHDTWAFFAWGHDILAALADPWPASGPFPSGRALWIHEYLPAGTPQTVDETAFRLLLSQIGARSPFYAVPLYALRFLWLTSAVQALLAAWVLWVAVGAFALSPRRLWYALTLTTLTATSTLPFFAAFIMPDLFGGLLILALGLLLFLPDRLSTRERRGLLGTVLYGIVAHTSNAGLAVLALPAAALLMALRRDPPRVVLGRLRPAAAVLLVALLTTASGLVALRAAFGRPIQNPPFVLGRVIADGPGLAFLQRHCDREDFVACELRDPGRFGLARYRGSDLIFPETHWGPQPFTARTDPTRRERFYAEARSIILGAVREDPVGQLKASFRNTLFQLRSFGLEDLFVPLPRMLASGQVVGERVASITPGVEACRDAGEDCDPYGVRVALASWHRLIAFLAFLVVCARVVVAVRTGAKGLSAEDAAALFLLVLVAGNAFIAGALSMPVPRLQGRVAWLVVFAAVTVIARSQPWRRLASATSTSVSP